MRIISMMVGQTTIYEFDDGMIIPAPPHARSGKEWSLASRVECDVQGATNVVAIHTMDDTEWDKWSTSNMDTHEMRESNDKSDKWNVWHKNSDLELHFIATSRRPTDVV
jgi:hypothetical protein